MGVLSDFEEQLIVSTIGSVMDTSSEAVNVMLMNAARYVAKQLVERVKGHFPAADQFELKEEQLLTYEQFEKYLRSRDLSTVCCLIPGKGTLRSVHPAATIFRMRWCQ